MRLTLALPARATSSSTWPISRRSAPSMGANNAGGRAAEDGGDGAFAFFARSFGRADFPGDAFFSTRLGAAARFAADFLTFRLAMVSSTRSLPFDVDARLYVPKLERVSKLTNVGGGSSDPPQAVGSKDPTLRHWKLARGPLPIDGVPAVAREYSPNPRD